MKYIIYYQHNNISTNSSPAKTGSVSKEQKRDTFSVWSPTWCLLHFIDISTSEFAAVGYVLYNPPTKSNHLLHNGAARTRQQTVAQFLSQHCQWIINFYRFEKTQPKLVVQKEKLLHFQLYLTLLSLKWILFVRRRKDDSFCVLPSPEWHFSLKQGPEWTLLNMSTGWGRKIYVLHLCRFVFRDNRVP